MRIRIPHAIAGVLTGLVAAALIAGGAALLWGDHQKDADGYVSTDSHEFRSASNAIVSENIELDLAGVEEIVDGEDFGDVRLKVDPENDERVFVGIARTADVGRYLRGVGHTVVEDVDYDPFRTELREVGGDRRPMPPVNARFWAASASGHGEQTVEWDVEDGDWSVVVMNADGSKGVKADVEAGAKLAWLDAAGWGVLGGGLLLAAAAIAFLIAAFRRPRGPRGNEAPTAVMSAA
jgi:hypothetical protein